MTPADKLVQRALGWTARPVRDERPFFARTGAAPTPARLATRRRVDEQALSIADAWLGDDRRPRSAE